MKYTHQRRKIFSPLLLLTVLFMVMTMPVLAQKDTPNPRYTAPEGEPLEGWRICVDPGHGGQIFGKTRGYTGGTRSCVTDQTESDANLRVGLFLWDLLTQAGAEVVMTRTFETRLSEDCFAEPSSEEYKKNRFEELNIRCRVAEANDCDFLVSIHHNAFRSSNVNFSTAFFFESGGSGQNEVEHPSEAVEMSRTLASAITEGLGKRLGLKTRPPRHGNYHLLRETSLPSVIVECAFMTNPEQARWMEAPAYSRLAALGIFEGILDACTGKQPDRNTSPGEVHE